MKKDEESIENIERLGGGGKAVQWRTQKKNKKKNKKKNFQMQKDDKP